MSDKEREAYKQERDGCVGILERFAQRKYEDDQRRAQQEHNDFPQDSILTEEEQKTHRVMYEQKLNELRHDTQDSKVHAYAKLVAQKQHEKKLEEKATVKVNAANLINPFPNKMTKLSEEDLFKSGNINLDANIHLMVAHAYCPKCGTELISKTPKMFNPYTGESMAPHVCEKCHEEYNLEYAYPRLVILGADNKEVQAFGI